jgi:hypothetical protein
MLPGIEDNNVWVPPEYFVQTQLLLRQINNNRMKPMKALRHKNELFLNIVIYE